MCRALVFFLFAGIVQATKELATNDAGDADSMDKLIDRLVEKLFDRSQAVLLQHTMMDKSTLGKPGHLAVSHTLGNPGQVALSHGASARMNAALPGRPLAHSAKSTRPQSFPPVYHSPASRGDLHRQAMQGLHGGFADGVRSRNNIAASATPKAVAEAVAEAPAAAEAPTHPAYDILSNEKVEEYGVQAILYEHKKSGAQVMSVIADDDNKVFGVTFRTPPADSTGLPHILEHSVLCGSDKYPVKEPFVDLLKGSLQNFLNAFTYPDRTCYPVATTNTKDFYNLASVYLDAVLRPRAAYDPQVLQQEGWHYELEKPEDPLTYKGVVYNEMKGVYSNPDSVLSRAAKEALFPDNTYGVDSGGDPVDIPKLTFDDFKNFHSTFYHPSNARIFYYGDDDPKYRLEWLDKELQDFEKKDIQSEILWQPKTKKPERMEVKYPIAKDAEPKHIFTVNWLLNEKPLDSKEELALNVLNYLMLGTSQAKLRKILTESQLGDSVNGGGLSDELLQATFSVGLKGVKEADVATAESLVISSIDKIAEEGFEEDAIAAAMNTIEFNLREFNTGGFPKGLSLMLGMMPNWIYGKEPADGIRFETGLAALKKDLADGKPVFQDLLKKYFTTNDHRVTIELKPDTKLEAETVKDEESRLEAVKSTLTKEQIDDIIESTKVLKEAQAREDSAEAKATLPRLTKDDIPPKNRELPIEVVKDGKDGGEIILTHTLPTAGILYADIGFDFSNLDESDLELLPLFTRMTMETGTSTMDEVALQRKIGTLTGGISASTLTSPKHSGGVVSGNGAKDTMLYFMLRGKAVTDKVPALFDLMKQVLTDSNLNNQKRAIEMLRESKIRMETSVISSGHLYASTRLGSRYSFLGYLGEKTGGLTAVSAAGGLLEQAEKDWPTMFKRLTTMRDKIVKQNGMVVNLSGDEKVLPAVMPAVDTFVGSMKKDEAVTKTLHDTFSESMFLPMENEGFTVPSQVNYVVKGGPMYKPGDKVSGATSVVTRSLSLQYLWDNVRVMGGAYGGFARFSDTSGRMVFMSYRDPNLQKTLDIYDKAPEALLDHSPSKEDILQDIIGTVADLDKPMAPDSKGYASMVEFLSGESAADRQAYRDGVLNSSAQDYADFGERLKKVSKDGSICVVGSDAAMEEANKERPEGDKLKVGPAF